MSKKPKGWYKAIAIRPVVNVEGYESYEKVCGYVAETYFVTTEKELYQKLTTNRIDSKYITFYILFKVGEAKCPAYWVSKELLTALMQSEIDVEIESLHWAMKTGMFMLPKGIVSAPENSSIHTIFWHYDDSNKALYWAATNENNVFCRAVQGSERLKRFTYTDTPDYAPQVVRELNQYLQAIFLRLLLIMECRPELVDTESQVIRVNKGFAKDKAKDFYEPLWIGRNYRVQREDAQDKGGTHASPRVHWRRGYLRNQPYGEGRQQRKLIWIEPVLVLGKAQVLKPV